MSTPADQIGGPNWDNYRRPTYSTGRELQSAAAGQPDDVEWADYGKSIMAGGASLVQSVGWLANVLGSDDIGGSIETLGSDAVDYWNDSLSDPAKAEIAKQVIRKNDEDEYEWGDPSMSTIGLMGAQSVLGTAAGMGVGAGLTKVLQVFANPFGRAVLVRAAAAQAGKPGLVTGGISQAAKKLKLVDAVTGAAGFGLGEGSIGGISAGASVYDNIMGLDHKKLMGNERYQQVYESTDESMNELERHQYAADTVAKEASTSAGWQSGLTTALLGAPMGAYFGRILGGAKLSNTYLKGIATGALGEAAQEFGQSGVEQYISNIQTMPFDPSVDKFDDVLNAAVSGAMAGALMGGPFGAVGVGGAKAEVDNEVAVAAQERMAAVGGKMKSAAKRASAAGADEVAVMEIVNDAVTQRIDVGQALDNLAALEAEAKADKDENGDSLEPANATQAPPPKPPDDDDGRGGGGGGVAIEAETETDELVEPAVAETKATPATEIPTEAKSTELELIDPTTLEVDADQFQFKAKTDAEGVSSRLKGVKTFDKMKAGVAIVYENKEGKRYIVDGHQRVGLAKRAIEGGQDPAEVQLPSYVLREVDGVTPEEATLIAATKNIAEGSGSPIDAAKVLRQIGPEGEQEIGNLPPTSALVQQAKGLKNLDDDAFAKAVNEVVDPKYAAIVGEMVPTDGPLQNAAIEVLRQTQPANATQARAIVDQVRTVGTETTETEDLFGEAQVEESLYLERAKVLDAAQRSARRDKATFKTLINKEKSITGAGKNKLDRAANESKISDADAALTALSTMANTKGPVSDALTEAAREVKAGAKPGTVAQKFLKAAVGSTKTSGKARGKSGKSAKGARKLKASAAVTTEQPTGETVFSRKADRDPQGHCFENTGRYMMNHNEPDLVLVHGYMMGQGPIEGVRFAHSWLERKNSEAIGGDLSRLAKKDQDILGRTAIDMTTDERVADPVEMPAVLYRSVGQAEVQHEYTHEEVLKKMVETGHFGPWDMEEHPDAVAHLDGEDLYSRRTVVTEADEAEVYASQVETLGQKQADAFAGFRESYRLKQKQRMRDEIAKRDAKRNTGQDSTETGDAADLFSEARRQEELFSRKGKPLEDITLTREVEIEETGEVFEYEQSAAIMLRQHDKRAGIVEKLRSCVRA